MIPTCQPPRGKVRPGARFGRLTVVAIAPDPIWPPDMALVKCDCGGSDDPAEHVYGYPGHNKASVGDLESWVKVSCGCLKRMKRVMYGERFGKLVRLGNLKGNVGMNHWRCDCGNECYAKVKLVRTGVITQCPTCANKGKGKGGDLNTWQQLFFRGMSIHDHAKEMGLRTDKAGYAEALANIRATIKAEAGEQSRAV